MPETGAKPNVPRLQRRLLRAIEALTTPLLPSDYLELLNPLWSTREYELPYNTGPLLKQWGMVQRTIIRLAFPGGSPRPKPGPYAGDTVLAEGEGAPVVA